MADIEKELNDIKNAVYGREVRGSIHDGIKKINDEVKNATDLSESAKHQVENIQQQVNQLVVEGDSSVEAAQARVDASGNVFTTLKERLDTKETQLANEIGILNKKTDSIVSVKEFGAVGNGIADDTQAIKNAVSYIQTKGGGCLIFPPGTYAISDYIFVLTGNISILGYGAVLRFKKELDRAFIIRHPSNTNVDDFSETNRISNVLVEGLSCDETVTGGFLLAQNVDGLEIRNIKVYGSVDSNAISLFYCTDFVVQGNTILNNPSYGVFVYRCRDGVVLNNYIDSCLRGVVVKSCYGAGTSSEQTKVNIKVVNNSIYDFISDGISGGIDTTEPLVENVIVEGNTVVLRNSTVGGQGIRPAANARNWVVKGNILKNCQILISDGGSQGHIVEANQIDITDVTAEGFDAISVRGDSAGGGFNTVSKNIIKMVKNRNVRGILIKSGLNIVEGNVIFGGDPAIDIRDEPDVVDNVIVSNTIKDYRVAIYYRSDGGRVNDGQIISQNKLYPDDSPASHIVFGNRVFRRTVMRDNYIDGLGFSNFEGYAIMNSGQTRVTVTHGLFDVPQFFSIVPTANIGNVWVDNVGRTTFDIVCSIAPTSNVNIRWMATV